MDEVIRTAMMEEPRSTPSRRMLSAPGRAVCAMHTLTPVCAPGSRGEATGGEEEAAH
jgi:hypothetical protein